MTIKIEAAARILATKTQAQTYYVIRKASTKKTVEIYEGDDGKARAHELVNSHNKFYPNDQWYITEEVDGF